jgi:hypothetical protein
LLWFQDQLFERKCLITLPEAHLHDVIFQKPCAIWFLHVYRRERRECRSWRPKLMGCNPQICVTSIINFLRKNCDTIFIWKRYIIWFSRCQTLESKWTLFHGMNNWLLPGADLSISPLCGPAFVWFSALDPLRKII